MVITYEDYLKDKRKRLKEAAKGGAIPLEKYAEITGMDLSKIGRASVPQQTAESTISLSVPEEKTKERTWFQQSDGNILQMVGGSATDLLTQAGSGLLGMGETILDSMIALGPYAQHYQMSGISDGVIPSVQQMEELDKTKKAGIKTAGEIVQKDLYDEQKLAKSLISDNVKKVTGVDSETMSIFGEKTDALAQSAGQLVGQLGVNALVPGAGLAAMGMSAFGGEMENALNQGATHEEAVVSGAVSAGAEVLTEKLFGYFGAKGMDDVINKTLANKISNATVRTLAKIGVDASGEGAEEVLSGVASAIGQKLTYMDEKELNELFSKEDALESFIGGAVLGSVGGGMEALKAKNAGRDMVTGLTQNEQTVIDAITEERIKEAEKSGKKLSDREKSKIRSEIEAEMDDGAIDIDKIESILGGDEYKTYKEISEKESRLLYEENALKDAPNTIDNAETIEEIRRQIKELKDTKATQTAKDNLYAKVQELTKNDRLVESYNEKGRRGQAYEADLTQYDTKQQAVIQKAIDSGILNNTNRTHKFVDMIAKISADKGVSFDFTNNQRLKESGFSLEGKTVNGFIQDGNISLNINSAKALNKVVGHEITHVLEGTELYDQLQETIIKYAQDKGDYDTRWESIVKLYRKQFEGQMTDERMQQYKAELTADLVGDYLFSDPDFVNKLSTEQPTIFQKIFDEIKYMVKVATAGSKEEKQLLEVKRAFDKAYKENSSKSVEDIHFDLVGKDEDGIEVYETSEATKKLSYSERNKLLLKSVLEDYRGRTAKFYKNGEVYYALYNEQGVRKGVYGDKKSDLRGRKAKTNIGADGNYIELAENALYTGSLQEQGKTTNNNFHTDAKTWDYYEKTIKSDGKYYDVLINVKDTGNEQYVYDITLKEASLPHRTNLSKRGKLASNNIISEDAENTTENRKYSFSEEDLKEKQLEVVLKANPAFNETSTWIRSKDDILTFEEALNSDDYVDYKGEAFDPSYPYSIAEKALKTGKITVYSSYPIEQGVFVSPSRMEAESYSGTGKVYSKTVDLTDVAWIDPTQGQYAKVDKKYSLSSDIVAPTRNDVYGTDIMLDIPTRSDIALVQDIMDDIPIRKDIPKVGDFEDIPIRADVQQSDDEKYKPKQTDYPSKKVTTVAERNEAQREALKTQLQEKQRLAEEVHNTYNREIAELQQSIERIEQLRIDSHASFNKKMSQLRSEYDATPNKDTKSANALLQQIENTRVKRNEVEIQYENQIYDLQGKIAEKKRHRADSDANSEKAINDLKARIDKMNTKEFKRAEKRKTKQEQRGEFISNLIGDTSTWVDKKMGIYYKVNTLRRNLRDIVRDENGNPDYVKADAIYDFIQGAYNHKHAQLNREANAIKQKFRDMKITKEEDAYIQMLGEYRHNPHTEILAEDMTEFYNKHKDKIDEEKVDKIIDMAREMYDDLFVRLNEVLREEGMQEIQYHKGYFPHFTEDKQGPIAKLLGWKTKNDDIPTDIAGLTENFNPGKSYQSFSQHRTGDSTDYSFMKGLDNYVQGSLDWIYHIDDIQNRRALENEIRYRHSDKAVQEKIEAINQNEEYSAEEAQEQIDMVLKEARNPLNNFVSTFRTQTNTLAGKKSSMDREMEQDTNRRFYSTVTNLSNRVNANMVGGSISSALTNFIPITRSWAEVSPVSSLQAMKETIASYYKDDGTIDKSDFLTNRLRKNDALYKSWWDKAGDKIGWLMEACDDLASQTVWRSKYMENIASGMSETEAIKNADQFAENIMAGRSRGNAPAIFDSKNPVIKMVTAFQLEVANDYMYMLKDLPQEMQNETKGKLVAAYGKMFIGAYVYNALTGSDAAFEPISIIEGVLRDMGLFDEDEEKEPGEIVGNLVEDLIKDVPFVGGLMGGGRIPISSALPYDGIGIDSIRSFIADVSEGDMESIWEEMLNPAFYLLSPAGGGGQLRKTLQGLKMFDDDLPIAGSYTNSGKLRFSVDDDIPTRLQAAVFGQYASENARDYFENGRSPLTEKQTRELVMLDIPIRRYWDYRQGLKKIVADKDENGNSIPGSKKQKIIEYIDGLDVDFEEKLILFKYQYPSDNTYNYEILEYLKGRTDISDAEKKVILKDLDFTVDENGNVRW